MMSLVQRASIRRDGATTHISGDELRLYKMFADAHTFSIQHPEKHKDLEQQTAYFEQQAAYRGVSNVLNGPGSRTGKPIYKHAHLTPYAFI